MPRPDLTCCTPFSATFPTMRWIHSRNCRTSPMQRVTVERPFIAPATPDHPAGANLPGYLRTWMAHPVGHRCADCLYAEHWLDRDDDPEVIGV